MPLYAYACSECGVVFERRQSFSDEPIHICPECGGPVHRLIQPAGIIFKGSGFYVTDNRGTNSSLKSSGKKDDAKAESKGSASAGASESKTAPASTD